MLNVFVKKNFATDYGVDCNNKIEQYRISKGMRNRKSERVFCLDCLKYRKCRGRKFPDCQEAKEFFETLKI